MKAIAGLDRITFDPQIMAGQACIRGMRMPVSVVINLIANGLSTNEIIEDYPYLEPEDIQTIAQICRLADPRASHFLANSPSSMKFLGDMGISPRTIALLREQGYDAIHLIEQNLDLTMTHCLC